MGARGLHDPAIVARKESRRSRGKTIRKEAGTKAGSEAGGARSRGGISPYAISNARLDLGPAPE